MCTYLYLLCILGSVVVGKQESSEVYLLIGEKADRLGFTEPESINCMLALQLVCGTAVDVNC